MGPRSKQQSSPLGPDLRLLKEAVGNAFYTQNPLGRLLSCAGIWKETHTKDGDGLLIIIIKKYIYIYMYIYMYICRNKGSEDINSSINSSYI